MSEATAALNGAGLVGEIMWPTTVQSYLVGDGALSSEPGIVPDPMVGPDDASTSVGRTAIG